MKISECPNRQVVDDRTRTETSAVASKVATKAALEETNMLPGENDTFVIAAAVKNDSTVNVHC
jgi:hypothetical protein